MARDRRQALNCPLDVSNHFLYYRSDLIQLPHQPGLKGLLIPQIVGAQIRRGYDELPGSFDSRTYDHDWGH